MIEAMEELDAAGSLKRARPDGTTAELTKDDLLISMAQKAGYESVADHGITVVLDTNLTPELLEEGMVREIVSKVQTMRKDSGFEVMDHIAIGISGNPAVADILKRNEAAVKADTLADEVLYDTVTEHEKEWNLNGETVTLSVKKLS